MTELDRRSFLSLMAASAVSVALRVPAFGEANLPLQMLVVGDSLIWGQGLEEKDKIYTLTADRLRVRREVDVKVKAHSGATIRFDAKEAEKYRAAGKDENHFYKGEVNISTPSMFKQVETAAAEYRTAGHTRGAGLVMLSAGITDIAVEGVLDPFGDNKKLPTLIEEVCRRRVGALLDHISANNPDALIALIGYFPILGSKSSKGKIFNGWLETLSVPGPLQSIANNGVMRPLLFNQIFKKVLKRSRIWSTESDRNLKLAVDALNTKAGRQHAIFIPSPLTEDHAAEAPDTKLFRMLADGTVTDPLYRERGIDCKAAFDELQRSTGIKQSSRRCSYAAVGHPDQAGSRLYAEAAIRALGPRLG